MFLFFFFYFAFIASMEMLQVRKQIKIESEFPTWAITNDLSKQTWTIICSPFLKLIVQVCFVCFDKQLVIVHS